MKKEDTVTASILWVRYFHAVKAEMPGANHNAARKFQFLYGIGLNKGEFVTMELGGESLFVMRIRIGDLEYNVDLRDTFKEVLQTKHLTSSLRQKIINSKPDQVEVIRVVGKKGTFSYVLSTESTKDWARGVNRVGVAE